MGFRKLVVLGAVLVVYGSVMLRLHKRPFSVWVLFFEEHRGAAPVDACRAPCETALFFWAFRIFHLVFYGEDAGPA